MGGACSRVVVPVPVTVLKTDPVPNGYAALHVETPDGRAHVMHAYISQATAATLRKGQRVVVFADRENGALLETVGKRMWNGQLNDGRLRCQSETMANKLTVVASSVSCLVTIVATMMCGVLLACGAQCLSVMLLCFVVNPLLAEGLARYVYSEQTSGPDVVSDPAFARELRLVTAA